MPFYLLHTPITQLHVDAIVMPTASSTGAGEDCTATWDVAGADAAAQFVIHATGFPGKHVIHATEFPGKHAIFDVEKRVRECYRSIFRLALEKEVQGLAIPIPATESRGTSRGAVVRAALAEAETFMTERNGDVYLVAPDEYSGMLSEKERREIEKYLDDWDSPVQTLAIPQFIRARRLGRKDCEEERLVENDAEEFLCAMPMSAERSLEDVIGNLDKTFMELVFTFADAKGISDVELQKRSNIGRKAFSKLKCGTTKNPSKSTALALAIGLRLNLDETKDLLSRAGLALSPCSRQDLIVRYFIEKKNYNIYEINIALFEYGEDLLGSQAP